MPPEEYTKNWDEFDWCFYYDREIKRQYKKQDIVLDLRKECEDVRCKCRGRV
jgi:hypothetical protein